MLKGDDLEFFAVIASSASLAAVARTLNVSASAVSQRLQALEQKLGVQLLHRRAGRLLLSDEGEMLAIRGRTVVRELNAAKEALAARQRLIAGRLRLIAPLGFGRRYIAPAVASFRGLHPDVVIDLTLTDRPSAISSDSWDIAFHVGGIDAAASSVTVRKLASNERFLCASPAYLERRGSPKGVANLAAHDCIALQEDFGDGALWCLRLAGGSSQERVRVKPVLTTNDGSVAKTWALAGLGVLLRSEWDLADELRTGTLQRVLEKYAAADADVVALLPCSDETRPARTRTFLEHIKAELDREPWRNRGVGPNIR